MSDDRDTVKLPAIAGDEPAGPFVDEDPTLTDEFQIDDDVRENEATRRLESGQLPSIQTSAQSHSAVPGKNSTLPLPAVTAAKTASTPVPEAVLAAMRGQKKQTEPDRPPITGESVVRSDRKDVSEHVDLAAKTATKHAVSAFAHLRDAGPDDETVDRAMPAALMSQSGTRETFPEVAFEAEIDGEGKVFIPRKYMGTLRYGQKVEVTIKVVSAEEN
jgi:hypothetical protein